MSVTAALLLLLGATETPPEVADLLPPAPLAKAPIVAATTSAEGHARALRAAPEHEEHFWVRGVHGKESSTRIIFVIPQYHRDATTPSSWTTLGKEITQVQKNIDRLTRRLVHSHRLQCIGTEGSAVSNLPSSSELSLLGWWRFELRRGRQVMLETLGADANKAKKASGTIDRLLDDAIRQHLSYLDGVGAAQARLGESTLVRLGIEDAGKNTEALELLAQLDGVEKELAKLDPETRALGLGIVGEMWLREYPAYEKETLLPLDRALIELETVRSTLRDKAAADGLKAMGTYLAIARRVRDALIEPEAVADTIAYYRTLGEAPTAPQKERKLSPAERKRKKALQDRYAQVAARYDEVTRDHREHLAARKLLERMQREGFLRCALVMGAGHEEGLTQALLKQSNGMGVVVVAPFNLE